MPKSRIILAIGFFIALLPILGFPHAWESFFEMVGGLGIVLLSVLIAVDKRLSQKAKAERRLATRRARVRPETPVEPTELPFNNGDGNEQHGEEGSSI
jgi:hypothetical protein